MCVCVCGCACRSHEGSEDTAVCPSSPRRSGYYSGCFIVAVCDSKRKSEGKRREKNTRARDRRPNDNDKEGNPHRRSVGMDLL